MKNKAWKGFENRVAQLYKELGCLEVSTDISIKGNQIDVAALIPSVDGTYGRAVISCKYYASTAGVAAIREWYAVFRSLFDLGKADIGIVVSDKGFTQNAKSLARDLGLRLLTIRELEGACVDFKPYLVNRIRQFEEEPVFKRKCYIPMKCSLDSEDQVRSAHVTIKQ